MKSFIWILIFLACFASYACKQKTAELEKYYLIRVENETLTVSDFIRAFEIARMDYPDEAFSEPATIQEIQTQILREMTEELIIINRAKELGISISDQRLENEIWKYQKDYPEGTFEKVLLENAISFFYWKESLRRKLLKDMVVHEELEKTILVTPQEIKNFYISHFSETPYKTEDETQAMVFSQKMIRQLHKEKAKELYPSWIKSLWDRYSIEFNQKAWNKITGP